MSKYGLEPMTQGEEIASLRAALERHGAHKCATYAASLQAELDRLRAEKAELQKQNDALRGDYPRNIGATITEAFADNQRLCAAIDRLRAEKAELVECLLYARAELIDYEYAATGETYNNTRINAALAKAANETEGK